MLGSDVMEWFIRLVQWGFIKWSIGLLAVGNGVVQCVSGGVIKWSIPLTGVLWTDPLGWLRLADKVSWNGPFHWWRWLMEWSIGLAWGCGVEWSLPIGGGVVDNSIGLVGVCHGATHCMS